MLEKLNDQVFDRSKSYFNSFQEVSSKESTRDQRIVAVIKIISMLFILTVVVVGLAYLISGSLKGRVKDEENSSTAQKVSQASDKIFIPEDKKPKDKKPKDKTTADKKTEDKKNEDKKPISNANGEHSKKRSSHAVSHSKSSGGYSGASVASKKDHKSSESKQAWSSRQASVSFEEIKSAIDEAILSEKTDLKELEKEKSTHEIVPGLFIGGIYKADKIFYYNGIKRLSPTARGGYPTVIIATRILREEGYEPQKRGLKI